MGSFPETYIDQNGCGKSRPQDTSSQISQGLFSVRALFGFTLVGLALRKKKKIAAVQLTNWYIRVQFQCRAIIAIRFSSQKLLLTTFVDNLSSAVLFLLHIN